MKISKWMLVLFFAFVCFSLEVRANQYTHAIGDTGYMITEAMWAGAAKTDSSNYNQALKLQREAKMYLRGTHKKGRSVTKAMELTKEAYQLAKTARDNALQASGQKVSH